jgi:two-component system, OmpR family, phosphate regulon sensor histidine kinase PhoR
MTTSLGERLMEAQGGGGDLRLQRAILLAQQDLAPDGILIVDRDGRMVSFNRRFVEMWRIPQAALDSGSDQEALESVLGSLADPEAFVARVRHLYEHQRESSRNEEIALKDGRVFERDSAPIFGVDGPGYYGRVWHFRDVTGRKKAEAALAESQAKKERERVERELISNVSHELRTPTASILGFAETLLDGGLEDRRNRREFVRTIHRHARRLHQLIEDLLDLASAESGRRPPVPEALDLSDYLKDLLDSSAATARRKGIELRRRLSPGLVVSVDEPHLHRVMMNLLDNALKYTPRGGRIEVRAQPAGGSAVIAVSDTGIGIPKEDLPRIFERFFRARNAGAGRIKGTGLGLALVKHIVEANRGSISVESVEGRGSVFRIELPRAA